MRTSAERRLRASLLHFASSAGVAALASVVIFKIWYPYPFSAISGGTHLFLLLVCVDVVLGPALTAVIANPAKPSREFARDLTVIVMLQLGAFVYGLYSLALARPVAVVFEMDLLRAVSAADIHESMLREAAPAFRQLSWSGPKMLAAVKPTDPTEQLRSIELELGGIPLAAMPAHWRPYETVAASAWQVARPVSSLTARYPSAATQIINLAAHAQQPVESLKFLPLLSRRASWVAVIAPPNAKVVGYLPFEGFF